MVLVDGDTMNDIFFSSQEELYRRVIPALNAKLAEMHRLGYTYVSRQDIWNCLIHTYWKRGKDLQLSDIVHDILHTNNQTIDEYIKGKNIRTRRGTTDFDKIEVL